MSTWSIADLGAYPDGFPANRFALVDENGREWMWGTYEEMCSWKQFAEDEPRFRQIAYEGAKDWCRCGGLGLCNGCQIRSGGKPPSE